MVDPVRVSGSLVVAQGWPFSLSPDGVADIAPDGSTSGPQCGYIPFDEIFTVREQFGEIRINERRFLRVDSSARAVALTGHIERVWKRTPDDRASEIRATIASAFDDDRARTTWKQFQERTRLISRLCFSLLVFAFVLSPVVILVVGPYPSWMYLLTGVIGIAMATAVAYFRAHTMLYPSCSYDRWAHAIVMVLLPVAAIRCLDKLSRDAMSDYDPVVVAPIVCGGAAATPFLRRHLIDLRTSPSHTVGLASSPAIQCAEWFWQSVLTHAQTAVERIQSDVMSPPIREDGMASYCPRCHAQFSDRNADCSDCPGVRTLVFNEDVSVSSHVPRRSHLSSAREG